jgi:hypothetical protein
VARLCGCRGFAPKTRKIRELDDLDKHELLKRGTTERDKSDIERVKGIGAAPCVSW